MMMDDVGRWESLGVLTWRRLFSMAQPQSMTLQTNTHRVAMYATPNAATIAATKSISSGGPANSITTTRAVTQHRRLQLQQQQQGIQVNTHKSATAGSERATPRETTTTATTTGHTSKQQHNTTKERKKKQCTRQTRQRRTDERQRDTPWWRRGSRYLRRACGRWRWLAPFPTCAATTPASKFNGREQTVVQNTTTAPIAE